MDIAYAILGLLSWQPLSGYDLKKIISESDIFYWSGNNNQIYNSLVHLHAQGLVSRQVEQQESAPAKKIYTITEAGREALRQWLLSNPELPELRNTFLMQLAWADPLDASELDDLLGRYEEEVDVQLQMRRVKRSKGASPAPNRTPRESYLWEQIDQHITDIYQNELDWVRKIRKEVAAGL